MILTLSARAAAFASCPELAIVPGTSHLLMMEKPDLCNTIIAGFLAGRAVPNLLLRHPSADTADASGSEAIAQVSSEPSFDAEAPTLTGSAASAPSVGTTTAH